MALQFRHGRVEVETDLLLGVDDVLLPEMPGSEEVGATVPQSTSDAIGGRRFEAELFSPSPSPSPSRSASVSVGDAERISAPVAERSPWPDGAQRKGAEPPVPSSAPLIDHIVPPDGPSKAERLRLLAERHARECPHCTAATGHRSIVFGEGDPEAALAFVGEAPGETEDLTGRPFVGPAGEKLDGMIAAMGLARGQVYIANVLKTRPPGNRTPLASEVERCGPYLLAQLAIIRPRAIVTLGGPASKLLLSTELGITRLRGVVAKVTLGAAAGAPFEVPVMPTFHPAYLLRNYTAEVRGQVWSDLLQVIDLLGLPRPAKKRADEASRG